MTDMYWWTLNEKGATEQQKYAKTSILYFTYKSSYELKHNLRVAQLTSLFWNLFDFFQLN